MPYFMVRVYLKIHGLVQGIFFRANTQKEALKLGLSGWVRNTADGGVEVLAQGKKKDIDTFINWCHKGPTHARVDLVDIEWKQTKNDLLNFDIKY